MARMKVDAPLTPPLPPRDITNPSKLYNYIGDLLTHIRKLDDRIRATQQSVPDPSAVTVNQLDQIRDALQAGGSHALNIEGMQGRSGDPQLPRALVFAALPAPSAYPAFTQILVGAVAPFARYHRSATVPATWVAE